MTIPHLPTVPPPVNGNGHDGPPPRRLAWMVYASILLVLGVDWVLPAGIVVSLLLCIPILATSTLDRRLHVIASTALSTLGFVVAGIFTYAPAEGPLLTWATNRALLLLILPTMGYVSWQLQRRRLTAEQSRDAAVSAGQLNRLLVALVAHDLRAPLVLAGDGFDYVERTVEREQPVDLSLVGDVRARLRRSLRTIEGILSVARADVTPISVPVVGPPGAEAPGQLVREVLEAEISAFQEEARERGKEVVGSLKGLTGVTHPTGAAVLGHALAVLLDNAIRHAAPGVIWVDGSLDGRELQVLVTDPGPAGADAQARAYRDQPRSRGAGLGLELVRALMSHAGGALDVSHGATGQTICRLRLPGASGPAPAAPAAGKAEARRMMERMSVSPG